MDYVYETLEDGENEKSADMGFNISTPRHTERSLPFTRQFIRTTYVS